MVSSSISDPATVSSPRTRRIRAAISRKSNQWTGSTHDRESPSTTRSGRIVSPSSTSLTWRFARGLWRCRRRIRRGSVRCGRGGSTLRRSRTLEWVGWRSCRLLHRRRTHVGRRLIRGRVRLRRRRTRTARRGNCPLRGGRRTLCQRDACGGTRIGSEIGPDHHDQQHCGNAGNDRDLLRRVTERLSGLGRIRFRSRRLERRNSKDALALWASRLLPDCRRRLQLQWAGTVNTLNRNGLRHVPSPITKTGAHRRVEINTTLR